MARSLALSGAVMLLLAESKQEARSMFVGVPRGAFFEVVFW